MGNGKCYTVMFSFVFLVLVSLTGCDKQLYEKAINENTIPAYEGYLQRHQADCTKSHVPDPDPDIRLRLNLSCEALAKLEYDRALKLDSEVSYGEFSRKCPTSERTEQIATRLNELRCIARRRDSHTPLFALKITDNCNGCSSKLPDISKLIKPVPHCLVTYVAKESTNLKPVHHLDYDYELTIRISSVPADCHTTYNRKQVMAGILSGVYVPLTSTTVCLKRTLSVDLRSAKHDTTIYEHHISSSGSDEFAAMKEIDFHKEIDVVNAMLVRAGPV